MSKRGSEHDSDPCCSETQPIQACEVLDLSALSDGMPRLSPGLVWSLIEACSVCLDERMHAPGVTLTVDGKYRQAFSVKWTPSTVEMRNSFDDEEYATEQGAYCLATMVLTRLTEYKVVRRAKKKTGFDWWLAKPNPLPFQQAARLEVSGIRNGTSQQVLSRLRIKERQTTQSDDLHIPAYAIVVEFGRPTSQVAMR